MSLPPNSKRIYTSNVPSSSMATNFNKIPEENVPIYEITDVAFIVANNKFYEEIKSIRYLNNDIYTDDRLSVPLLCSGFGKKGRSYFQHACYTGNLPKLMEYLRINANPDTIYQPLTTSGLQWAIVGGHPHIVQFLMNHYYVPAIEKYEEKNKITTVPIPITDPVPHLSGNEIKSSPKFNNELFDSLRNINFFSEWDGEAYFFPPLDFHISDGYLLGYLKYARVPQIQALRELLYSTSKLVSNDSSSTTIVYSQFWGTNAAKCWLPNLVVSMILCQEPHPIDVIVNAWDLLSADEKRHYTVLPHVAALQVGNIPLFDALRNRFPILQQEETKVIIQFLAYFGPLDLLQEYHQQAIATFLEEILFEGIGVDAVKTNNMQVLEYLRDNAPPFVWTEKALQNAISQENLALVQFLRNLNPPCPWDETACTMAAIKNRLDILQWLRSQQPPCPINAQALLNARARGHTEIIRWIEENDGNEEDMDDVDDDD